MLLKEETTTCSSFKDIDKKRLELTKPTSSLNELNKIIMKIQQQTHKQRHK